MKNHTKQKAKGEKTKKTKNKKGRFKDSYQSRGTEEKQLIQKFFSRCNGMGVQVLFSLLFEANCTLCTLSDSLKWFLSALFSFTC